MPAVLDLSACAAPAWATPLDLWARALIGGVLLMVLSAVGSRRFFPGRPAFMGLLAALLLWITLSSLERASQSPACRTTLALLNWGPIMAVPVLWALFIAQHVRSDPAPPARRWWWFNALPVAAVAVLAAANGSHGLLYGDGSGPVPSADGLLRMRYARGPLFWLLAVWAYALMATATLSLLRARAAADAGDRVRWTGMLVVSVVPLAANASYVGGWLTLWGSDPTPVSFAVAGIGLSWLIHREQLFDVVPAARRLLFTELPDPVFILDARQRVAEANHAARQLVDSRGNRAVPGAALTSWPRVGPPLSLHLQTLQTAQPSAATGDSTPGVLHLQQPEAFYEVQARPLGHGRRRIGTLVQLHDVTLRERAHAQALRHLAEGDAERATLRDQALRDPLTGAWNRRALEEHFAAALATAQTAGTAPRQLALVLMDLDHFKRVNDEHGHAVGDAVLRDMVASWRQQIRTDDTLYRLGGEEFALLLPGADAAQAERRVQGLHQQAAAQRPGGLAAPVSFSAGVATTAGSGWSLSRLLTAADQALYDAKAAGRSCTRVAPEAPGAG